MGSDRLLKLKNGSKTTWYLDKKLLLQIEDWKVTAFQVYGAVSERLLNKLLPANYSVAGGYLSEYKDGNLLSVKSPMEVLLTWKKER